MLVVQLVIRVGIPNQDNSIWAHVQDVGAFRS